jgi:hypothetical protein
MLVLFLAIVSTSIFAAHILDVLRTAHALRTADRPANRRRIANSLLTLRIAAREAASSTASRIPSQPFGISDRARDDVGSDGLAAEFQIEHISRKLGVLERC